MIILFTIITNKRLWWFIHVLECERKWKIIPIRRQDSFFTQHLILMLICQANNSERRTIIIIPECSAGKVVGIEWHQSSADGRFMYRVLMTFPSYDSRQPYHKIIEKPTIVAKRQIVQTHWSLSRLSFLLTERWHFQILYKPIDYT